MLPKIKISAFLLKRLEAVKQQCSGCLFGVFYGESTLLLISFNVETTIGKLNYEQQIQHKLPAELDLCGLIKFGDCNDADAHLNEVLKSVDITDNPVLVQCEIGTLVGLRVSIFMHGKFQAVAHEVMEADQMYNDFCFTRLNCDLLLCTEQNPDAVRREMQQLRKMLTSGSLVFNVATTKIFVTSCGSQGNAITSESIIDDIVKSVADALALSNNTEKSDKKLKKSKQPLAEIYGAIGCDYDVINIDVLKCKTRESVSGSNSNSLPSPSLCIKSEEAKVCVPLEVDAMAILCKTTRIHRLYDVLIESICRSLRLFEQSLIEKLDQSESAKLLTPRIFHFYHKELGHFLSCSYLDGVTDDESVMQEKRKRLHRHFGLPITRPYFRRANAVTFRHEVNVQEAMPLLNTHVGLRPSGVADGKQYLVQGNYRYYHYLQQQMQDKGWGCAYRSLQTICSWFLLQGYTSQDIPTHRQIQEYLHKIGDKPASFVGSAQWIGSTELSMCLQGFLNVDSKIQHVASGGELATLASELANHFQTQGTPVMIGGGVLAHTIIGIDYCIHTGQIKFLILDPHYTGSDDLQIIQSKGWCGWKAIDFWDKKSYYNLCMPQRPSVF